MNYEVIEYEGKEARKYPDGSIRNSSGHFMAVHPEGRVITSDNSRELLARRSELARARTASRIMREAMAIDPDVKDEYDAHALMYAMQYTKLADADKPNVDDADKIAEAMGTRQRSAELRQVGTGQAVVQALGGDDIVMLIMRRRLQAGDVVDGDVVADE